MKYRRSGFSVAAAFLFFSQLTANRAFAARGATIDGDADVNVFENPRVTSKVIEKLHKKTKIVVSNLPVEGFHKVRTPSGNIGFVAASSLILQPPPTADEILAAGAPNPKDDLHIDLDSKLPPGQGGEPEITDHSIRFLLLGDANFFTASGIVKNFDTIGPGYSYGGELMVMLTPRLGAGIRIENIFKSIAFTDTTTSKNFQLDISSFPLMGGFEFAFIRGTRVSLILGGFVGLTLQTGLKSSDLSDPAPPPNVSEYTVSYYTGLLRAELDWEIFSFLSVFAEFGYRYLRTPQFTVPTEANNGASILNSSFAVNLSGTFAGGGVVIGF